MHIDDPEALNGKKHLADQTTPMAALNMIKQKIKNIAINENASERKNPQTNSSLLFSYTVGLQVIGVQGKAEDTDKKSAK